MDAAGRKVGGSRQRTELTGQQQQITHTDRLGEWQVQAFALLGIQILRRPRRVRETHQRAKSYHSYHYAFHHPLTLASNALNHGAILTQGVPQPEANAMGAFGAGTTRPIKPETTMRHKAIRISLPSLNDFTVDLDAIQPLFEPDGNAGYPFSLALWQGLESLDFTTPVTFFVGDNGAGKSTLLEAIAVQFSLPALTQMSVDRHPLMQGARDLAKALRFVRRPGSHVVEDVGAAGSSFAPTT